VPFSFRSGSFILLIWSVGKKNGDRLQSIKDGSCSQEWSSMPASCWHPITAISYLVRYSFISLVQLTTHTDWWLPLQCQCKSHWSSHCTLLHYILLYIVVAHHHMFKWAAFICRIN
jgi:hypothetical protein